LSIAAETDDAESKQRFSSKHLAKVLDKCFTSVEMDDHTVSEEKDKGGQLVQVERTVKGLVARCLEKDGVAFRALENTKSKSKEHRLSLLSESRPDGCSSAADLLLWLVEVRR